LADSALNFSQTKSVTVTGTALPTIKAIRGTGYQLCVTIEIG
jgi:hypothetical protein